MIIEKKTPWGAVVVLDSLHGAIMVVAVGWCILL